MHMMFACGRFFLYLRIRTPSEICKFVSLIYGKNRI